MRSVKQLIQRISERPRLVFAILLFLTMLFDIFLILFRRDYSVVVIVNMFAAGGALTVYFLSMIYDMGYRIATIAIIPIAILLVIGNVLFGNDFYYVSVFIMPLMVFLIMRVDLHRINSRRNVMILFCLLLLVLLSVIYARFESGPFNVVPIVYAVGLLIFAYFVKPVLQFNGIHFSLKKYWKPRDIKKVSVVIPNYNYARYLKERVNSILNQNYPIYELIILDDKSTDDSIKVISEIMEDLKNSHPEIKIRFLPNEKNSGNVFRQWEKCFRESSGDYLWICEADDSCNKYFLNAVMRAFDNPKVILSYAESCSIDENGKKKMKDFRKWIDMFDTGHWRHSYVLDGKDELEQVLCINNTIANVSSVVFKKEPGVPFGDYLKKAQEFTLAGDWYFYSKVLLHGKIAYHEESLNYHRMHGEGVTLTTDNYEHYLEILKMQREIGRDVRLGAKAKKKMSLRRKTLEQTFGFSEDELKSKDASIKELVHKKRIKDEVLLSVILCAYNVEKYIGASLKSILGDLPDKTEVIVIDDGSTDKTASIVKEVMKKNPSVKYYYKTNGGLSSAKNYGLKKARGRYIIFMDADDRIAQNGYEVMLKKAIETDADMVICAMELIFADGTVGYRATKSDKYRTGIIQYLDNGLMASSNNKMTKRTLFDGTVYPEGKNNEDIAVTPVLIARAKNIQYIPSAFYKYYQRSGSIQNSVFDKKRLVIFDTCKEAIDKTVEILPKEKERIEGAIINNQIIAILVYVICDIKDKRKRNEIIREFCERYKALNVGGNRYVQKYVDELGMGKLISLIYEGKPERISRYIRLSKNKIMINGFMNKVINRKEKEKK